GAATAFQTEQPAVDLPELVVHLVAEALELLIHREHAFGDELDLRGEALRHHVEVPSSFGCRCIDVTNHACLELARASLETVHTRVEPVHTPREPVHACLEPVHACFEAVHACVDLVDPSVRLRSARADLRGQLVAQSIQVWAALVSLHARTLGAPHLRVKMRTRGYTCLSRTPAAPAHRTAARCQAVRRP